MSSTIERTPAELLTVDRLRQWARPILARAEIGSVETRILTAAFKDWTYGSQVSCEEFRGRFRPHRAVITRLADRRILDIRGGSYDPTFAAYCALYVSGAQVAAAMRVVLDALLTRAREVLKADANATIVAGTAFNKPLQEKGHTEDRLNRALLLLVDASVGVSVGSDVDGKTVVSLRDEIFDHPSMLQVIRRCIDIYFNNKDALFSGFASYEAAVDGLSGYQKRRLSLSPDTLREARKAVERIDSDPAAAITSARTLLEATLKWVAHQCGTEIPAGASLNQAFDICRAHLGLQHPKSAGLARALITVSNLLGALRNDLGDAHAPSPTSVRATVADAQLAVSASLATAAYVLERYEAATH